MLAKFMVGLIPNKECRSYARNEIDNFIDNRGFNLVILENDPELIMVYGDSVDLKLFASEVNLRNFSKMFSKSCGVIGLPYDDIIEGNLLREERIIKYAPYYDLDASKPHLVDNRDTMASVVGLIRSRLLNMRWNGIFVKYKSSLYVVSNYADYGSTLSSLIISFDMLPMEKEISLFNPKVSDGI